MQLFRLTPVDTSSTSWQMSRFRGPIVVRAENEADAREEAVSALLRAPDTLPDGAEMFSPWGDRSLVTCMPADASEDLPIDGEPGIVWPPGAADAARQRS